MPAEALTTTPLTMTGLHPFFENESGEMEQFDPKDEAVTGISKESNLTTNPVHLELPKDPEHLPEDHSTVQQLRELTGEKTNVAILATEKEIDEIFNQLITVVAQNNVIDPNKKNFFAYAAKGGHKTHVKLNKGLPGLIPPPPSSLEDRTHENSGVVGVERTDDKGLREEGAKITSGFEQYKDQVEGAHVYIIDDLLDSNKSLQHLIDDAIANGATGITVIAPLNKLDLPYAHTHEPKQVLTTNNPNITLTVVIASTTQGDYWVGSGIGCDYLDDIDRDGPDMGVKIDPPSTSK